jgi:predicted phosphodiesterase
MPTKIGSKVRRAIVTPDKHFPYEDKPAINALIKAIGLVKPDIYVDLGDVGEWESVSEWQWKRKKRPPLEYIIPTIEEEIEKINKGMDGIDKALDAVKCKERHFCEGNHDNLSQYTVKKTLKLDERGYTYHPFGKFLKIGKLFFYHGHQYGGQYHAANHLRKLGCNIMYGHWHDLQQMSATHMDGPKSAWSIGCLKDMSSEANLWLKNRRINWAHAFAIVDFYEQGLFTVNVVQIINGKCSVMGKFINGNN